MKKFDIGLLEIYKELKLSDRRFKEVTKYELNICKEEIIFDVEEIGLLLSIVPYALETLGYTYIHTHIYIHLYIHLCIHLYIS